MNAAARQGTADRERTATWNGPRLVAGGIRYPYTEVTLRRPDPAGSAPARDGDRSADPSPSRPGFRIPARGKARRAADAQGHGSPR